MPTTTTRPTTDLLPAPPLIGLPEKFPVWRPGQAEAVLRALDSDRRFVVLGMPTGFGKSLTYMAAGLLHDPAIVLTSTKGLQNQLLSDFGESGVRDIRGMNNYECLEGQSGTLFKTSDRTVTCDEGPCLSGWECHLAKAGCTYFDARRGAASSHIPITNYAYWMGINGAGTGEPDKKPPLGYRGRLILDEAHAAIDELSDYLAVEIGFWEIEGVLGAGWPRSGCPMEEWRQWARTLAAGVEAEVTTLSADVRTGRTDRRALSRLRELRDLGRRLGTVATARGQWVVEEARDRRGRKVVRFDPVWPGEYAEGSLFLNTPKVVLTSATIRPKTLELLGIPEDQYEFIEYASSFPISRRPFIWCPTVRVRYDMDPGSARQWASKIDAIIRQRPDRRGVVHTVSYSRADYLRRYSEHSRRLIFHDSSRELHGAIEQFLKVPAASGPVLVSPSIGTGFDFPGDACRFQIIGKVPFPSTQSIVLKARQERDPDYFAYVAAQNLVQMAGRGMRSPDDWCETIIVDDNWSWFRSKYKDFMPKWFLDSCKKSIGLPEPLRLPR